MKITMQLLTLLFVGAMLASSLAACESETSPADGQSTATTTTLADEVPEVPETPATAALTPEELLRKVKSADEVMIEVKEEDVRKSYSVTYRYNAETLYIRDANAVKYYNFQQENQISSIVTQYYDLDSKLSYRQDGRSWTTEPLSETWADFGWVSELNGYVEDKQLLGKAPWKLADGKYIYTEEGIELRIGMRGYEGDLTVEINAEGNTYTITETMSGGSEWISFKKEIKITFGDMTVDLPAVN